MNNERICVITIPAKQNILFKICQVFFFFFSDSIWTWDLISFDSIEIYFSEEKTAYVSYISL